MGASNQKASGTPIKLLMKHWPRYSEASFIPTFSECIVVRMLLVSIAVRGRHMMRYVHTYIFVNDTNPRPADRKTIHRFTRLRAGPAREISWNRL
jgi:hypothetical protein